MCFLPTFPLAAGPAWCTGSPFLVVASVAWLTAVSFACLTICEIFCSYWLTKADLSGPPLSEVGMRDYLLLAEDLRDL